jgi:hypothetical protein
MNIQIDKLYQNAHKGLIINYTEMGLSLQANSSSASLELSALHDT